MPDLPSCVLLKTTYLTFCVRSLPPLKKPNQTGDPAKRMNPGTALGYVGLFGLLGTAIKMFVTGLTDK